MAHLGPSLRRKKVRERPGARAALAALVSLALNALLFLLLARAGAFQLGEVKEATRVALAPIGAAEWARNRAVRPPGAAPEPLAMPAPPKPPAEPEHPKGQVVDIQQPESSKPPRDARFLSEHDTSVEKETRSRYARPGYRQTQPTPSAAGARAAAPGQNGESEKSAPGLPGAVARAAPQPAPKEAPSRRERGDLASARAPDSVPEPAPAAPAPVPGAGEGGLRRRGAPGDLHVPPGTLSRLSGGPAPDHLEGIEEGEGTWLNSRGWKYASYFNRVKSAVASAWDPWTPWDARDPDRSMYGRSDRQTVLDVTLDDRGNLKKAAVARSCGLEFLDLAAVKAFQDAAPFPNPPPGVQDPNGEIRFPFSFTIGGGHGVAVWVGPRPITMPNPPMR